MNISQTLLEPPSPSGSYFFGWKEEHQSYRNVLAWSFVSLICNLGSMLWSQFSAIFAHFRRKYWRFSSNPCYGSNFDTISCTLNKNAIFSQYFENHNIGPSSKYLQEKQSNLCDDVLCKHSNMERTLLAQWIAYF
jgi:hypothetical protein